MSEVQFQCNINTMFVQCGDDGVMVCCGWSVAIPKETVIKYVQEYGTDMYVGFYENDGKVTLCHGSARLSLSKHEAESIIDFIKTEYGV